MRPFADADWAVVPNYQPPPSVPEPPSLPSPLNAADWQAIEALPLEDLRQLIRPLLSTAHRQRRTPCRTLVPHRTLVRLNGLLARIRHLARGLCLPEIPPAPEHMLVSPVELIRPLELAQAALVEIERNLRRSRPPSKAGAR